LVGGVPVEEDYRRTVPFLEGKDNVFCFRGRAAGVLARGFVLEGMAFALAARQNGALARRFVAGRMAFLSERGFIGLKD
jgi:hypothetical protein